MAKRITQDAVDFIKSNGSLYDELSQLLKVDLPTIGTYLARNIKVFSRHDTVEAIAQAMGKQPSEIFKEAEEKQAVQS